MTGRLRFLFLHAAIAAISLSAISLSGLSAVRAADPPAATPPAATSPATADTPTLNTSPEDAPAPYVSGSPYKIVPEDQVLVRVINHSEADGTFTVGADGTINYPHVGSIKVVGENPKQLEEQITRILNGNDDPRKPYNNPNSKKAYYLYPEVRVYVTNRQVRQINLIGTGIKVAGGKMPLKEGWHLFDALASAGFSTDRTDFYDAQLFRPSKDSATPPQIFHVDLDQVYVRNPNPSVTPGREGWLGDVQLQPDDTIVINTKDQVNTTIQVIGEVGKTGLVPLPRDGSLVTVLNDVQPSPKALLSAAKVQRDGVDIPIDLSHWFKDGKIDEKAAEFKLKPGDRLIIPANQKLYSIFGPTGHSGSIQYPDDRKLTLLTALADAGGSTEGIELNSVTVIRPSPTGGSPTLFKRNVKEMIKEGKLGDDMPIEPNDIIYVPAAKRRKGLSFGDVISYVGFIPTLILLGRGHF